MNRESEFHSIDEQLRYPDRDRVVGVIPVPDACITDIQLHPDLSSVVTNWQFQHLLTEDFIKKHAMLSVPFSKASGYSVMPFYSGRVMSVWENQQNPIEYAGFLSPHMTQKGGGFSGELAHNPTIIETLLEGDYMPGLATVWDDDGDTAVTTALLAHGARATFRFGRIILDTQATKDTFLNAYATNTAYTNRIEHIWERVAQSGKELCIPFRIGDTLTRISHVHHLYGKLAVDWKTKHQEILEGFQLFRKEIEMGLGIGSQLSRIVPDQLSEIYDLLCRIHPTYLFSEHEAELIAIPMTLTAAQAVYAVDAIYKDPQSPVIVKHNTTLFDAKDIGPSLCATDMDIAWKSGTSSRESHQRVLDEVTRNFDNNIWYYLLFLVEQFPKEGVITKQIKEFKQRLAAIN